MTHIDDIILDLTFCTQDMFVTHTDDIILELTSVHRTCL